MLPHQFTSYFPLNGNEGLTFFFYSFLFVCFLIFKVNFKRHFMETHQINITVITKKVRLLPFREVQAQANSWQSALCDVTDLKPQPAAHLKPSVLSGSHSLTQPYHLIIHRLM